MPRLNFNDFSLIYIICTFGIVLFRFSVFPLFDFSANANDTHDGRLAPLARGWQAAATPLAGALPRLEPDPLRRLLQGWPPRAPQPEARASLPLH